MAIRIFFERKSRGNGVNTNEQNTKKALYVKYNAFFALVSFFLINLNYLQATLHLLPPLAPQAPCVLEGLLCRL